LVGKALLASPQALREASAPQPIQIGLGLSGEAETARICI